MKYRHLGKSKEFMAMQNKEFIRRFKPDYAMEFTVSEIVGVPNMTSSAVGMESHLEVRYFLFD